MQPKRAHHNTKMPALRIGTGDQITHLNRSATVVATNKSNRYDLLYTDGSGDINVDGEDFVLVSKGASGYDGDHAIFEEELITPTGKKNTSNSIGWNPASDEGWKTPTRKSSEISWNPSGAGDGDPTPAKKLILDGLGMTPSSPLKPSAAASPRRSTTPLKSARVVYTVNQSVEVFDHSTKKYTSATVSYFDEALGTVDVTYSSGGGFGKGIPVGMLMSTSKIEEGDEKERKKKKRSDRKSRGNEREKVAEPGEYKVREGEEVQQQQQQLVQSPVQTTTKTPEAKKLQEINAILKSFTLKELDAALMVVKGLNSIVLGKD